MTKRKHGHYFRDVSHLTELDVYRLHSLFGLGALDPSGALCHASKKILVAGLRGAGKSPAKDIAEARDTLIRKLEMMVEDGECWAETVRAPFDVAAAVVAGLSVGELVQMLTAEQVFGVVMASQHQVGLRLAVDTAPVVPAGHPEPSPGWTSEARIDVIGQNGNEGEHYEEIDPPKVESVAPAEKPAKQLDERRNSGTAFVKQDVPPPALRRPDPIKPKAAAFELPDTSALVDPTGKPQWADVPEWARYLAQNAKGVWLAFQHKPYIIGSAWVRPRGRFAEINSGELVESWRQSICERPAT